MLGGQPTPANLSATFRVASREAAASAATLRPKASAKGAQQMFSRKLTRSIAVGAAAIAVAGGSYGIVSATSSSASPAASSSPSAASSSPPAASRGSGGGGSNARSGPAAGGSSGTVSSVSTSGFTMTTSAGQKVTV